MPRYNRCMYMAHVCFYVGSMSVSSCRCCMFVSCGLVGSPECLHPVVVSTFISLMNSSFRKFSGTKQESTIFEEIARVVTGSAKITTTNGAIVVT